MAKWFCSSEPSAGEISTTDYLTRQKIESILERYTRDMENYSYYGSNMGVSENVYDDVAEDIMSELGLWEDDEDE
jgi:hypothetical protein